MSARRDQVKLDSLQPGAVVLDKHGHAWQLGSIRSDAYWYRACGDSESVSSWDIRNLGPFTMLHEPAPRFPSRPARPNVEAVFAQMHGGIGSP